MSAVDYSAKAATALRLLTRFGQSVTRVKTVLGGYDPEEDEFGWYQWYFQYSGAYNPETSATIPTTDSSTRTGALLNYGKGIEYVRGMQVTQRDKRLLLDASGAADISDTYTVSGVEYTVQSLEDINPAGTVVMYDLHVRAV